MNPGNFLLTEAQIYRISISSTEMVHGRKNVLSTCEDNFQSFRNIDGKRVLPWESGINIYLYLLTVPNWRK